MPPQPPPPKELAEMARHFLRDDDLTPAEQKQVLALALEMAGDRFAHQPLVGPWTVAIMFDKSSTRTRVSFVTGVARSEEHTSELQSRFDLVCRLLLEK